MNSLCIKNGRIIDPANRRDEVADLFIVNGLIAPPPSGGAIDGMPILDATGLVVCPGLIDMHVHLREPGQTAKETIATGARAAARGGFTSVLAMPNTNPVVDSASVAAWVAERAEQTAAITIFTSGAISLGLKGEELAPIGSLNSAGVLALTDDGHCIQNHEPMRRAVEYARMFDLPVLDHCQDYHLVGSGVVNEGYWSTVLGLPGWPPAGEELMVTRNILLAELCESPIHCQHLSCKGSVDRLREARARGVPITAELCPHHIALTDETARLFDTNFKMNPPLRTEKDINALVGAVADGTISVLASDHAPHTLSEKEVEFDRAPFGIVGLETELGLFLKILVHERKAISLMRLVEMFTVEPARILHLNRGTLSVGAVGDVTVFDPDAEWIVDPCEFESLGRNTPFAGWELKGRATHTIVGGTVVYNLSETGR
jgi:dihydroorotase